MAFELKINGKQVSVDADPQTPLLWVLRDHLQMTGTKYGCGINQCGACTVTIDGQAARSCNIPAAQAVGRTIVTIEGLSPDRTHAVQKAWAELDVPQCGYCQAGQMMAAVGLLARNPNPTDADIDQAMNNLCRCGTYVRIRAAVKRAAELV
ncbi:(2Fe-2S)-binding protein [Alsobacter sp. SYSU M60028]|uniref:(2Fe-2S)-binding protein n=1 Tax=Alsobacter ponti TaxID=2962936 RepID=A0ABT1LIK0_9HYPH|nr:(2Fe-2S)-binding protein [Alsobacter ponti]MCP8940963.1 (2Fe-2S)-binding protein [Alsobacter ponti]